MLCILLVLVSLFGGEEEVFFSVWQKEEGEKGRRAKGNVAFPYPQTFVTENSKAGEPGDIFPIYFFIILYSQWHVCHLCW